jgi:hypothetical protein
MTARVLLLPHLTEPLTTIQPHHPHFHLSSRARQAEPLKIVQEIQSYPAS